MHHFIAKNLSPGFQRSSAENVSILLLPIKLVANRELKPANRILARQLTGSLFPIKIISEWESKSVCPTCFVLYQTTKGLP